MSLETSHGFFLLILLVIIAYTRIMSLMVTVKISDDPPG